MSHLIDFSGLSDVFPLCLQSCWLSSTVVPQRSLNVSDLAVYHSVLYKSFFLISNYHRLPNSCVSQQVLSGATAFLNVNAAIPSHVVKSAPGCQDSYCSFLFLFLSSSIVDNSSIVSLCDIAGS